MQKPLYWLTAVVAGWTLTSFLCHYLAKSFLRASNNNNGVTVGLIGSLVVTGFQMIFCVSLTKNAMSAETTQTAVRLMQVAHVLATLATNFSMAVTHASSTFAIKLMEPITGAIAQRIVLGNKLTALQYVSLPVIVIGSVMFAEDLSAGFSITFGSVLAFTSNILLAVRNVIIKKMHISNKSMTLRKSSTWFNLVIVCVFLILGSELLNRAKILPFSVSTLETYVMLSAFFHVGYSYISTAVVLAEFSVVGHAVCNIIKRLLVVGLLLVTGRRVASEWNVYGLIICAAGLIVYTMSKTNQRHPHGDDDIVQSEGTTSMSKALHSSRKYLLLLMMALCAGTLTLYTDMRNIRFVNTVPDNRDTYLSAMWHKAVADLEDFTFVKYNFPNATNATLSPEQRDAALKANLVDDPDLADAISPYLTTRVEVIAEAQRIHMNIFKTLLAGRKKVMLFHYSPSENKGDSAIAVGEFILLRKLNVEIIFHCPLGLCSKLLDTAEKAKGNLTNKDVAILLHGGGNVIGYPVADKWREAVIKRFPNFDIIMFPQSIYLPVKASKNHTKFCKNLYGSHDKLTFLWRDRNSYTIGKEMFPKVRSLLSPDIAYQMGPIPRTMPPQFDVIWLSRNDVEKPGYSKPKHIQGFHIDDWLKWLTPNGTGPMEKTFLMTHVGFMYLQRGRVVITDRLHGHILSTLLDIPHVFIDNKQRKISNYHNTWTRSVENIVFSNSSTQAVGHATLLLKKLDKSLPPIIGYY